MIRWIDDLAEQIAAGEPCVLVTVACVRGSAPRDAGAKMLVTEREIIGTIGGGHLEYRCAQTAFGILGNREGSRHMRKLTLGADCGQCCGGIVEVLFEPFYGEKPGWLDLLREAYRRRESMLVVTGERSKCLIDAEGLCRYATDEFVGDDLLARARQVLLRKEGTQKVQISLDGRKSEDVLVEPVVSGDFEIAVFGAGHVGTATVHTLSMLDCTIRWIDGRRNFFPKRLPDNVETVESAWPEREVSAMPAGTCYLVMTHSHPLDQEIVQRILLRDDFTYCGLIGSVSKRRQFEKRLRRLGLAKERIDRMRCPIGINGIDCKKPEEIAISVAAELLQIRQAEFVSLGENVPDNVRILRQ